MFSIAIVMPLFPVLVLGIYWKKATKQAAIVSSIVGTVLVLATYFVWNIGGTWYGAIGMLGSTICMVVVSLFTKQDSKGLRSVLRCSQKRHEPQLQDRRQSCCGAGRYEYRRLNHQRIYAGAAAKEPRRLSFMPL